ncbi:MAG: winged helix-turn-helix domain-containing protein [Thermoplasmatales archaeon]
MREIRCSDESKYDHWLYGIILIANGISPYSDSKVIGNFSKSIQNWVNSFMKCGFNGLREPMRPGRPPRHSSVMKNIAMNIRMNPTDMGYSQNLWDEKLLSYHIAVKYKTIIGTRQCERVFRKLGFRLRKPRPKIAKGDDFKKKEFKKTQISHERGKILGLLG